MTRQRLVVLFVLGGLMFGWPMLAVVERLGRDSTVPVLYLYLLGAWSVLVVAAAWVLRPRR